MLSEIRDKRGNKLFVFNGTEVIDKSGFEIGSFKGGDFFDSHGGLVLKFSGNEITDRAGALLCTFNGSEIRDNHGCLLYSYSLTEIHDNCGRLVYTMSAPVHPALFVGTGLLVPFKTRIFSQNVRKKSQNTQNFADFESRASALLNKPVAIKMNTIKECVYNVIRDDDENDIVSTIFDSIIVLLIVINVLLLALDTFNEIRQHIEKFYKYIDFISIIVFSIEYGLRVWTAEYIFTSLPPNQSRIKYVFSPKALIDFIALLSFCLPLMSYSNFKLLRTIRLLRILNLLKLNRYSKSLLTLGKVIKAKSMQIVSSFFIVSVLIISTSLLMYYIENNAQPGSFDNAFSSLWWTIATLTTVGYGDIYPVTTLGKILGIFISLMGIGLIAIPTGIISAGFIEQLDGGKKEAAKYNYCPHCGKELD
jgi:voltage-gated potassium channel